MWQQKRAVFFPKIFMILHLKFNVSLKKANIFTCMLVTRISVVYFVTLKVKIKRFASKWYMRLYKYTENSYCMILLVIYSFDSSLSLIQEYLTLYTDSQRP